MEEDEFPTDYEPDEQSLDLYDPKNIKELWRFIRKNNFEITVDEKGNFLFGEYNGKTN